MAAAAIWMFGSTPAQAAEPDIEASASIMIDADTGQVVFEDNTDELLPAASMSKMMTEYIVNKAIEDGDISWSDEVAISDKVREREEQLLEEEEQRWWWNSRSFQPSHSFAVLRFRGSTTNSHRTFLHC